MMTQKRIAIAGGGASGITAAIAAARNHAQVTILEQKDRIGKKILSTGNGHCNFSNLKMDRDCYRGEDLSIVDTMLETFGTQETIAFFQELGVKEKDRNGYLYPASDQASAILDVLRMELDALGVRILTGAKVTSVVKDQKGFRVLYTDDSGRTSSVRSDAVILSAGGKASPALGSDGSGYALAKSFGHTISTVVPALTALRCEGNFFKQLAGIRTEGAVRIFIDGRYAAEDCGELQLTNYGISGIPVFQVSRFASKALYEKKKVTASIDFAPAFTAQEWKRYIRQRLKNQAEKGKSSEEAFIGLFHKKLIPVLLKEAKIRRETPASLWTDGMEERFIRICKEFTVPVIESNPFEQAQICAGGVRTQEIDPSSMESIYTKGLYLTGELLDIDGICGGYNLQWAWATGYIAGTHAAKE